MSTFSNKTFEQSRAEISYKEILEFAPIGIIIFQRDWKVKFVNSNFFLFSGVLGENPQNVTGQSIYENRLFEKVDIRPELELIIKGESFEKEIVSTSTIRGGKVSLLLKGTPINSDGENAGGILILEDVKISTDSQDISIVELSEFREFLERLFDFYILIDKSGLVKEYSKKEEEFFSFLFEPDTSKGISKKKISPILFRKHLETVISSRTIFKTVMPFLKEGKEIQTNVTFIPFIEGNFEVNNVILLFEDIVKHAKQTGLSDDEIKELSQYQQITASVVDGLIGVNKNGRITFWNESSAKLFGLTKSEVFGKFIGKIFPVFEEKNFENFFKEIQENDGWDGVLTIGFDESVAEHFRVKIRLLNEGEKQSLIFLCSSITEFVKTEKALRESEEKYRNIINHSPDFICTLDASGNITYTNIPFNDTFKYSQDELSRFNVTDLIDSEYLLNNPFNLEELAERKNYHIELPLINKSGHKIYCSSNFSALKNAKGEVQSYNAIFTDITQKKESEKDLLLIRSVFEASKDGIALIHRKRFILVNDSFVKMFAYKSIGDMLDQDPLNLVTEKDRDRIAGSIDITLSSKSTLPRYDFKALRADGSTFEVENSVSTYEAEGDNYTVWVLRDITEEKKAQEALQISEERYRNISESINECIWAAENVKGDLKAVFYTPSIKKITSYEAQEFLKDEELWGKIIHPDDVDFVGDKMDNLYGDPIRNLETLEYRIIDKLGNVIWIENKITVIRNERGLIQKVYGIISDISLAKRVEEELKRSTQELKESNETKDRFISIISHDLRTPFSSILGFTDLLINEKDIDDEKKRQYIQFIQESSKSMLSLVNSILDWTRLQTGRIKFEPDRINARPIIESAIQILSGAALQKKIKLSHDLKSDFFIHADDGLLLQAFSNLISNAIKFTNENGFILVSARANVDKKQVEFCVQDTGIGIKPENIEKLFRVDTKFTTSGTAGEKGSGLGLSLVYDIIKKHGGEISVHSTPGKGSQFIFSIPVASSYILLVDDSKNDRILYSKLIRSLIPNYTILEAENGKHAMDIIKQSSPALVITDHNMPVMSGYDLVKQLSVTRLKYTPPVIILSGDINKTIEAEYKEFGIEFVFQKPVNLSAFKIAIEKSLKKAIYS